MAQRRLMECKHIGCFNLTRNKSGYCDEHSSEYEAKEKERRKRFNSYYNKDNKYNAFYNTKAWREKRSYILSRDDYLCQECLKNNKYSEATDVHHIQRLRDAWDKRLDNDNLISLCIECHKKADTEIRRNKKFE